MEFFAVSALNGFVYGVLLFMVSAGLTLIFGMMGVLNMAHASFYMIGAYVGYVSTRYWGFWQGLLLAPILVGVVGIFVERYCLRRVHRFGHAYELLLTFGISFIIEELAKLFFGPAPVDYPMPQQLRFAAFTIYGTDYPFYRVLMGGISIAMFALLFGIVKFTRVGIVVRAAVHKPDMVNALGYNVPVVFMVVFGIGAAFAGLAGAVAGAFYPTSPNMALELGLIVFVVVVVGGLGSLEGAFLASMLIGLMTSFAVGIKWCLADLAAWVGLGEYATAQGGIFTIQLYSIAGLLPFVFMLVILLVRPAGLLGEREGA